MAWIFSVVYAIGAIPNAHGYTINVKDHVSNVLPYLWEIYSDGGMVIDTSLHFI